MAGSLTAIKPGAPYLPLFGPVLSDEFQEDWMRHETAENNQKVGQNSSEPPKFAQNG